MTCLPFLSMVVTEQSQIHCQWSSLGLWASHCIHFWMVHARLDPPSIPFGWRCLHLHSYYGMAVKPHSQHSHHSSSPMLLTCNCWLRHDLEKHVVAPSAYTRCRLHYHWIFWTRCQPHYQYRHGECSRGYEEELYGSSDIRCILRW